MNFIKYLLIESHKHKRRHNNIIFLAVIILEILFVYANYGNDRGLKEGWMALFYSLPIMNTLFFPIMLSTFAGRLMDIEHKGHMFDSLYTFISPIKLFFTKTVYGIISIIFFVIAQCFAIIILAKSLQFPLDFPAYYMVYYGFATALSCILLFLLHLILAFTYRNQAVTISIGLIGSFAGLFLAYLPTTFLQEILPWSGFINSAFIDLDWNRDTRKITWLLSDLRIKPFFYSIFGLILLLSIAIYIIQKSGSEEKALKKKSIAVNNKISIHKMPIEFLKLKGSPAWFGFFIIPTLSAIIGTLNYLGNIEILTDGWFSLWTQHTLFLSYFFMPVIIAVFTGCIWRFEHSGTNINIILTHTTPAKIVISKYFASISITMLSIIWVALLYIIAGIICKIDGRLPEELGLWLFLGCIASFSICALHLFLALVIRNFILPVIIAFAGGIAGLACMAKFSPYILPYSLFDIAMTENNSNIRYDYFFISSVIFIIAFLLASILYLKYTDSKSYE